MAKKLKPVHPGEILKEEFMVPLGLSMNKMAMDLRVPVTRIADIVNERRGITADTALRFARYFKNTPADRSHAVSDKNSCAVSTPPRMNYRPDTTSNGCTSRSTFVGELVLGHFQIEAGLEIHPEPASCFGNIWQQLAHGAAGNTLVR